MGKHKTTPLPKLCIRTIDYGDAFPERFVEIAGVLIPATVCTKDAEELRHTGDAIAYDRSQIDLCELIAKDVIASEKKDEGTHKDAAALLAAIKELRSNLESCDIGHAVCDAMTVGRLVERLRFRTQFNQIVKQTRTTTRKLREAAVKNSKPPETINEAVRLYQKFLRENPNMKKASIEKKVHSETGVAPRTLRRHLKKSKK